MTDERLQQGQKLQKEIEDVKEQLTHCKIMMEHDHDVKLISGNNAFEVRLANELTQGVLELAKDALQRRLNRLLEEYDEL